jgi:hypothetical protein
MTSAPEAAAAFVDTLPPELLPAGIHAQMALEQRLTALVRAEREAALEEQENDPDSPANALARVLDRMEMFLREHGKTAPMDDPVEFVRALLVRSRREGAEAMRQRCVKAITDYGDACHWQQTHLLIAAALRALPLD